MDSKKTNNNKISESENCPKLSLALSRDLMPQISKEKTSDFKKYLKKNDVSCDNKKLSSKNLKASQMEFDANKVFQNAISPKKTDVIVSNDDHVLDGHHRWLGKYGEKVDALVVDLPILDLLRVSKEYCNSLKEEKQVINAWTMDDRIKKFVDFCCSKLNIKEKPPIYRKDESDRSFGGYFPAKKEITIITKNRHPMDVFRTIAHELVHHKQNEEGRIKDVSKEGETGSPIEDEANSMAGRIMRWWAKTNPDNFALSALTENIGIFVVGGPCSGKDQYIRYLTEKTKLEEVDIQSLLKKGEAKSRIVINAMADRLNEIVEAKKLLEHNHYNTFVIFVDTTNEISKMRNEQRKTKGQRMIKESVRFNKYAVSQKNKDEIKKMFKGKVGIVSNNTEFDTRMYKGNKPEEREWGKTSTVQIYQNDTPGQSLKDQMKFKSNHADTWPKLKEETGFEIDLEPTLYGGKKKSKKKKSKPRGNDDTVITNPFPDENWGIGQTSGRGALKPYGLAESIEKWASNPKTIKRFQEKYGDLAEQKLLKTAISLNETFSNEKTDNTPKTIRKIRESIDKGAFDMGTVPKTGKDESLPNDGKIFIRKSKKTKINK